MEMICTVCPTGCGLTVTLENGLPVKVAGNLCKRGLAYAVAECTNPVRTLTTTVRLCNGDRPLLPVRTTIPVPRARMREMVCILNGMAVSAPVLMGTVLLADILGSGADVVATQDVPAT
jgi:CxxC motif-containing protein